MTEPRWVSVGESSHPDAHRAGALARAAAVGRRTDTRLLVVFASTAYDLAALLAGVDPGDVPLVGCTTGGEIGPSGPGDGGVVVMALGGPGFAVSTGVATEASGRPRAAGAEVAGCAAALEPRAHHALLLLSDGLASDQQDVVHGAYDVVGALTPLVGGCSGDGLTRAATYQFHGTRVLRDAVVGVAIGSDAPIGIGVRHGWQRLGDPLLVTSRAGSRVHTLDDRPALDVYLDRLGAPAPARSDADAFTRFALNHPLGLGRRSGEDHVRFVGEADFADRSLRSVAEVPQGAIAWFMAGDAESVLAATDAACAGAVGALDGAPALGVLAFDCVARRGVFGEDGLAAEVDRIRAACGGSPVAGFYTYGEIARTRGISGFHNQTLVVLAFA